MYIQPLVELHDAFKLTTGNSHDSCYSESISKHPKSSGQAGNKYHIDSSLKSMGNEDCHSVPEN